MKISDECIACSACIDECPSGAIQNAGSEYEVNGQTFAALSEDHPFVVAELCDDCKSCTEVCPVEAITPNE
ncbi:MAG: 4Fe-4S binding protein [Ignavibacteria bacterium]|nr:4Fe-4S binding protein [Ignavibacteria bacterium]